MSIKRYAVGLLKLPSARSLPARGPWGATIQPRARQPGSKTPTSRSRDRFECLVRESTADDSGFAACFGTTESRQGPTILIPTCTWDRPLTHPRKIELPVEKPTLTRCKATGQHNLCKKVCAFKLKSTATDL